MSSNESRVSANDAKRFAFGALLWIAVNAGVLLLLSRRLTESRGSWTLAAILAVNVGFALLVGAFRARGWAIDHATLVAHALAAALGFGSVVPPLFSLGFSRLGIGLFLATNTVLLARIALRNAERERSSRAVRVWIVTASFLVYAAAAVYLAPRTIPRGGDEPHYLLMTHSLVADGDLDLKNNYRNRDYADFYFASEMGERHVVVNRRNEDPPIHDVGLPILLVPGYAAGGRPGSMIELSLFGALLALGIFDFSRELGASRLAASRAWAFFAFVSPLVVYSSQIYPDVVACGCVVWSLAAFLRFRRSGSSAALLAAGALLAPLPWLSIRYWLLVAPLGLSMMISVLRRRDGNLSPAVRLALLVLPGVVSTAALSLLDLWLYQTPVPNAGYFLYMIRNQPPMFSPELLDVGFAGLLFDGAFGLLPTAPVYVIALAGAVAAWRSCRWAGATVIVAVFVFVLFAAANRFWYGGWAPAPRYIVPAVALLAPLGSLVLEGRKTSAVGRALVAASAAMAVLFTAAPETRWNYWDGRPPTLATLIAGRAHFDYSTLLPSFIRAELRDYLVMISWAALVVLAIRWLAGAGRNSMKSAPSEVLLEGPDERA